LRSRSIVLVLLAGLVALACSSSVLAHDAVIETAFDGVGEAIAQGFEHPDADPFKGWAFVTVQNTGSIAWGDFHFKIFAYPGGTADISLVDFKDASMGGLDPISTQSGTTWTIDNNVVGAEMSLFFYGDPVAPGDFATFQVYTDNTVSMANFGLMLWPSPVPEPSSLIAFSTGIFGLAGFMVRRRR